MDTATEMEMQDVHVFGGTLTVPSVMLDEQRAGADELASITILNSSGDLRMVWDPSNETEQHAARRVLQSMQDLHLALFKVRKDGTEGGQTTVEEALEKGRVAVHVLAVPQAAGG